MLHTFWSVKGGSGVTVTAALYAAALARRHGATTLVDLCGDQPAALGLPEPQGAGWHDWLATPDGSAEALDRLLLSAGDRLTLLPVGTHPPTADRVSAGRAPGPADRVPGLVAALSELGHVVVDAGVIDPTARGAADGLLGGAVELRGELFAQLAGAGRTTLVLRPCYLTLRRAMKVAAHVDDIVVVSEPERALGARDVARLLGARVLADVAVDPAVARSVDAGTLLRRRHRSIHRSLEAST